MSVTPGIKIASPTGSPFAVAVMFFGNGLVMASRSLDAGIRDQVGAIQAAGVPLVCGTVDALRGGYGRPTDGQPGGDESAWAAGQCSRWLLRCRCWR